MSPAIKPPYGPSGMAEEDDPSLDYTRLNRQAPPFVPDPEQDGLGLLWYHGNWQERAYRIQELDGTLLPGAEVEGWRVKQPQPQPTGVHYENLPHDKWAERVGSDDQGRDLWRSTDNLPPLAALATAKRRLPSVTVPLQVWVDVDVGIAGLVAYLNRIPGVRTTASCQGGAYTQGPYVEVSWKDDRAKERLLQEDGWDFEIQGNNFGTIRPLRGRAK